MLLFFREDFNKRQVFKEDFSGRDFSGVGLLFEGCMNSPVYEPGRKNWRMSLADTYIC